MRGKYAAVNQILTGLTGFAAINAAATLLGTSPALQDFGLLFAIGTAVGLASMLAFTQVPGGAPEPASRAESASPRGMLSALRDPNLSNFLIGMGLVTLAATGLGSFVTLFMREEVGLDAGQVIRLQGAGLAGGLVTSYLWGGLPTAMEAGRLRCSASLPRCCCRFSGLSCLVGRPGACRSQ